MSAVDLTLELLVDTDILHHREVVVAVLEVLILKPLLLHVLHVLEIELQVLLLHVLLLLLQEFLGVHFFVSFLLNRLAEVVGAVICLTALTAGIF